MRCVLYVWMQVSQILREMWNCGDISQSKNCTSEEFLFLLKQLNICSNKSKLTFCVICFTFREMYDHLKTLLFKWFCLESNNNKY